MNILIRLLIAVLLSLPLAFNAFSQEVPEQTAEPTSEQAPDDEEDESYWEIEFGFIVGAGRSHMESLNQSQHGYFINEPWLSGGYYNGNFFVETDPANGKPLTIGYSAYESDKLQVNFIATPYFLGFYEGSQVRGDKLTGIDDRGATIDGGVEILSSHDFGQIGFRALHDLFNIHGGFALAAVYGYPVYFDKMVLWPSVGINYISREANDFYYGVRPHEVRADRPAYTAPAGFSAKLNLYFEYELNERTSMIGFSHMTLSDSSIHQSPFVDHNTSFAMGLGMIWIY